MAEAEVSLLILNTLGSPVGSGPHLDTSLIKQLFNLALLLA